MIKLLDEKLNDLKTRVDNLEVDIKVPYEMGMQVYHLNKFGTSKYPTIKEDGL